MSIILEALKKVAQENPTEAMGIGKNYELPEFELKKPEIKISEASAHILSRPMLISLAIIALSGFLFFYLHRERCLPVVENIEPQVQSVSLVLTKKPAPMTEGCAPVNVFKTNIPNNTRLTLNGIVSGIGKPAAIIDNKIVEEDALINGAKVMKIYDDRVELRNEASGEIFTLKTY